MKKVLAKFLCLAIAVTMTVCTATAAFADDHEPVKLRFIHWQTEIVDQLQKVINGFQEEYPYISIEQEVIPTSDWASVTAAYIAGNDAIDVIGVEPWLDGIRSTPAFYENNFLMDLGDLDCVNYFTEDMLNKNVRTDGILTSLPFSQHSMVVFYNKDIFAEYNLEVPKTYSEFLAICDVLTENGIKLMCAGEKDGWPLSNMTCDTYWSALGEYGKEFPDDVWNKGKTLEETGYREVIKAYADITDRDGWYGDPMATAYDDAPVIFATGKCAMYADGTWSAVQIADVEPDFEVGMFGLNVSEDPERNYSPSKFGMTLGIANRTEHPEECRMFLEYLFRPDVYETLCNDCMYTPCEKDTQISDPMVHKIADFLATRTIVPFDVTYSCEMEAEGFDYDLETALQGIVMKEYDLDAAMAHMQDYLDTARKAAGKA